MPVMLFEDGKSRGESVQMFVSQPRRAAARALFRRVSGDNGMSQHVSFPIFFLCCPALSPPPCVPCFISAFVRMFLGRKITLFYRDCYVSSSDGGQEDGSKGEFSMILLGFFLSFSFSVRMVWRAATDTKLPGFDFFFLWRQRGPRWLVGSNMSRPLFCFFVFHDFSCRG